MLAAEDSLPAIVDDVFPRPYHEGYPDLYLHSDTVIDLLNAARDQAQVAVQNAQAGVAWYGKLAAANAEVEKQQALVIDIETKLKVALAHLEHGSVTCPRPDLGQPGTLDADYSGWIQTSEEECQEAQELVKETGLISQKATLAVMRHRQVHRASPKTLEIPSASSELSDELEQHADDVLVLSQSATRAITTARQDAQILPILCGIQRATFEIRREFTHLDSEIKTATSKSIWTGPSKGLPDVDHLMEQVGSFSGRVRSDIDQPSSSIIQMLNSWARPESALREHLMSTVNDCSAVNASLHRTSTLLTHVHKQSSVLRVIVEESDGFGSRIDALQHQIREGASDEEIQAVLTTLRDDVTLWYSGLPDRIVFVAERQNPGCTTDAL